jgi:hypothetical protein
VNVFTNANFSEDGARPNLADAGNVLESLDDI